MPDDDSEGSETRKDYDAALALVVKRSFEVVLELVQEHVGVRRRDDCLLVWHVAPENSASRCRLLLHVQAAHELYLGLWAQEHAKRADLIQICVRHGRFEARRVCTGAPARDDSSNR